MLSPAQSTLYQYTAITTHEGLAKVSPRALQVFPACIVYHSVYAARNWQIKRLQRSHNPGLVDFLEEHSRQTSCVTVC